MRARTGAEQQMPYLLVIVVLAMVVYGVIRSIHAIADGISVPVVQHQEASCGSCGYSLEGLAVLTCPECGSDLLDVGIIGRRGIASMQRSPIRLLIEASVGWTFIAFVLLVLVMTVWSDPDGQWLVAGFVFVWFTGLFVIALLNRRRQPAVSDETRS